MTKAAKTQQALKIQGANGLEWQPVQVKLGDLDGWQGNPKRLSKLQAQRLLQSTQSLGQLQTIAVSPVKPDGRRDLYDGHQRDGVWSKAYNPSLTVWAMEASRPLTDDERKDVAVLSMTARGSFDWDILSNWEGLGDYFAADDLAELRRDIAALDLFLKSEEITGIEKEKKPNPRKLPLDIIYTAGSIGKKATDEPSVVLTHCCLAVRSGWMYGVQSSGSGGVCATALYQKGHYPQFIDNDYFNYDHELHLAAVMRWKPKYCTTRDVMTQDQCEAAGIDYYPLEKILGWAEELAQYAENVIIIPKYDCIKDIPEKFMLGFSVPTSHGETPLHIDLFRGRRVHLLGGSWKAQLEHLAALGDDVVSIDNNYIKKIANYGTFVYPDGTSGHVAENLNLPDAVNPLYIAIAASCGNIAAMVNKICGNSKDV